MNAILARLKQCTLVSSSSPFFKANVSIPVRNVGRIEVRSLSTNNTTRSLSSAMAYPLSSPSTPNAIPSAIPDAIPTVIPTAIPSAVQRRLLSPQKFEGGKLADGTIFRRPLPAPAIELSSPQGTLLFAEALQEGTAKCFFRLMEQLHTQNEPEYCGLATLVTVLNALNVDPHRRWKGVWRFYSEELLECCEPLTNVKRVGIDFDRLAGLAKCNGLHVDATRASDTSLDAFRTVVMEASQTEDFSLALAYSRKLLGQTGSGHYSPMGAYHAKSDHLLILDCARFKYRPHWVSVPLMFEAMSAIDPDTAKSRGFMRMSPVVHYGPPPAAHVLALSVKSHLGSDDQLSVALIEELQNIASTTTTAKEFLRLTASALEKVFRMELKGHGCSSPARKSRIASQLDGVPSFDDCDFEETLGAHDRQLQRKALVMCLDQGFLRRLLKHREDVSEEVLHWIKPADSAEELAVEISFTRPQLHQLLKDHYMVETEGHVCKAEGQKCETHACKTEGHSCRTEGHILKSDGGCP